MTLSRLKQEATELLAAAMIDDPRGEVSRLARGFGFGLAALKDPSLVAPAEEVDQFQAAVRRRVSGEPLAYVMGTTGFRRLDLMVDKRVLIPRPETESLVEAALNRCKNGIAVDVGTGSGAIAIALATEGEFSEVIGTDISVGALEVARLNALHNGAVVSWLNGDMLSPLSGAKIDLLVSNPPYLTTDEYQELDPSVRDWEPATALVAGDDGMAAYRRIFTSGRGCLRPGGWLALEIDSRRAAATGVLAEEFGWRDVIILDDLFGRARILLARQES